jgi:acyl-coenzyme A synthetase/AMP-(fatty) acid ligase
MAEFKCPKKIHIVESIPTTATGKIRRRVVAALLEGQR